MIDQESPIRCHPDLEHEYVQGIGNYLQFGGSYSDPWKNQMLEVCNEFLKQINEIKKALIVVASELRHQRYEGIPMDTD